MNQSCAYCFSTLMAYHLILACRNSAGFVYLRFENTQAALSAQRALHGRWFAGKMITATFMVLNLLLSFRIFLL